jgi:uncharacterized membrane protein
MIARVASLFVLSLALAVACGGKSKPPAEPVESVPAGGGAYGGDAYGGDAYGGVGYGGAMGGGVYGGGGGTFDCVSGVAECDQMFQKFVACAKTGTKVDEQTRVMVIDTMQQACEQVKQVATQQPENLAEVKQACTDGLNSGPEAAEQLGCTW